MKTRPRAGIRRTAAALALFAAVFAGLEVYSYRTQSSTWDESVHLTAGYLALTRGDFRLDPTHPPLARMWAALPLAMMPVAPFDTAAIDNVRPDDWPAHTYTAARAFLYGRNDADRLLYASRFMAVLLGIALGLLLFAWVREWLGVVPALLALACYTVEPNILAHAALVTTDIGATLFIFAACYFTWRIDRGPFRRADVAGLAASVALAAVTKWSGLLLPAMVIPLLAAAVWRGTLTWRRGLAIVAIMVAASVAVIWAAYGFRYAPSGTAGWLFHTQDLPIVQSHVPRLAALLGWIDDHRLLPNAYTQGFLYGQGTAEDIPAYLAGAFSRDGFWYYFPVAFLLKAPVAMVALIAIGGVAIARRRDEWANAAFILFPPAVFLGVAMESGINIGVRHILPVFPFAIMLAALGAWELLSQRRLVARAALAGAAALWLAALARVYPDTLTFFSLLVGGSANGERYLVDSNLDWGQHLKGLGSWMRAQGVSHINLAYFGTADPAYYGIDCTYLPGSPPVVADSLQRPQLPGYVAISATVLAGVYESPAWRLFYGGFEGLRPAAEIGHSIKIYWLDRWPDVPQAQADDRKADLELADALLFDLGWYNRAITHYRRYLRRQPEDGTASGNLAVALLQSGRGDEALPVLRQATTLAPTSAPLHRLLAAALCEHGDPADAEAQARRALALAPGDAVAHDVLGRALALQERWREAAAEFRRALAIAPGFADARGHLEMVAREGA